jgi:predicted PurR-regulated permease PerM
VPLLFFEKGIKMNTKYDYSRILKNLLITIIAIVLFILGIKLTIFYLPFLIGYIISIFIEPLIKFMKHKTNFSRKVCSIIVLVIVFTILVTATSFGIFALIKELSNFLSGMNNYVDKLQSLFQEMLNWFEHLKFSEEVNNILQNSLIEISNEGSNMIKIGINKILNSISSIPNVFIYFFITILATYFICSDKFYILDRVEHHVPKKWVGKIREHLREITGTLASYFKAEVILVIVTFVIVTIGLNIFYILRYECRISIFNGTTYRLYRCTSNTWGRNYICTLDNNRIFKYE